MSEIIACITTLCYYVAMAMVLGVGAYITFQILRALFEAIF